MNKSAVIGFCIAAALVVGSLFFYFNHRMSLAEQRDQVQGELSVAQIKLRANEESLDRLTVGIKEAYPLGATTQEGMGNATGVVHQTDFMFSGANTSTPKFIFTTKTNIEVGRQEVNALLAKWQAQMSVGSIHTIDLADAQKIKTDAETIKKYIENLKNTVGGLTPENSGLTKPEIDTYNQRLPSIEYIDQIIAMIDQAIKDAKANPSPMNNDNPVLSDEIIKQQKEVIEATKEVEGIQKKLDEIISQIPVSPVSPNQAPTPSVNPAPTPNPQNPQNQNNPPVGTINPTPTPNAPIETYIPPAGSGGNPVSPTPLPIDPGSTKPEDPKVITNPDEPSARVFNKSQGIIIQSGEPKLIEGDNEY